MSSLYIVLSKIWTHLDLGKKVVFLLFFFSFLYFVVFLDVMWCDQIPCEGFPGVGQRETTAIIFHTGKLTLPPDALLCVCPTGSSVQHLFHHRPRRLWSGLALPRGGRSDVHPGICWVHWSSARKHFPSQVCKYRTPLTHREPDPHLTSGGHPVEAGVSHNRRHWEYCGLGNASLLGEHFGCPAPPSSTRVPAC